MIAQEFERPAGTALRRSGAGSRDQMGFRPPVHFTAADFALRRPAMHRDWQPMFGQSATGALHGADTDPQGTHDLHILHGSARMILVRRQQNLGPQTFRGSRFAGAHKGFELQSFSAVR